MWEKSEKLEEEEDEEEELRGWLNDNERFKPCRIALHNLKPASIMSTADGSECFTTVYDATSDKSIAESICIFVGYMIVKPSARITAHCNSNERRK